jgi:serine/threonine protein kinase
MNDSTPEERESFFDSLNNGLLEVFDADISLSSEVKFPLSHEALSDQEGQYPVKLIGEIGRGGMKVIYKCQVRDDGNMLALATMLKKRPSAVEGFLREAQITQKLSHYNIIRVYDHGISERFGPYMAMNYVEGESLSDVLKGLSLGDAMVLDRYPLVRRLRIFKDVALAISFAHSQGVVHLDIKPENILIDNDGRVYVCDWGLAKMLPDFETDETSSLFLSSSQSSMFLKGSPGFMAPEQISERGKSIQTDIYQLGALLYSVIFLRAPVAGNTLDEVLENTVLGQVDLPQEDNDIVVKVIKVALSTDPGGRFGSVEEMLDILSKVLSLNEAKLKTTIVQDGIDFRKLPESSASSKKEDVLFWVLLLILSCLVVFLGMLIKN